MMNKENKGLIALSDEEFATTTFEYEANGNKISLNTNDIATMLANGNASVTKADIMNFALLCKHNQLDPFLKEAYLIKYDSSKPAQMVVGKEAYMKRMANAKDFQGLEAGIIVLRDDKIVHEVGAFKLPKDQIVGGWAKIHRKDKEPFEMKVSFSEYNTGKSLWRDKPAVMIRKVAIVSAIREVYPDLISGAYTEEELDLGTAEIVEEVEEKEIEANSQEFTFDEVDQEEEIPFAYSEEVEEEIEIEESPQVEPEIDGQTSIEDLSIDELPTSL